MTTEHKPSLSAELDAIRIDVQLSERQIAALPPRERWEIEDTLDTMQGVVRAINDVELRRWVEEGKTQTWIAERVGRSQQRVSQRCQALGLTAQLSRGGRKPTVTSPSNSPGLPEFEEDKDYDSAPPYDDEPEEVVEGEVVEPAAEPTPLPRSRGKVPCPTCGNPVDASVVFGE